MAMPDYKETFESFNCLINYELFVNVFLFFKLFIFIWYLHTHFLFKEAVDKFVEMNTFRYSKCPTQ